MSGGGSAPAAPDYYPLAIADQNAANQQAVTAAQQLDWAKQQYADQAPITHAYLEQMTSASQQQQQNATDAEARYKDIYQPVEDKFVGQATGWNSADRQEQEAGAAMGAVASQTEAARRTATANLESYGIDPSQTRYGALDLGTRISAAAGEAAAGTQSRLNTQATGLALEGEAINIGKGYPGNVAQSYAGATNSGQAGINTALNTTSTFGNQMGTPTQWSALSGQSSNNAVGAINTGFNNQMASYQANQANQGNFMSGLGSLIGGGLAIGAIGGMFK